MDLDQIIFGNYTLKQVLIVAGVVIVLLFLISVIKKLFKKEKVSPHSQIVRCKNCGWKGQISRYAGKCPKCNAPLGEQKAKKKLSDQ